MMEYRLRKQASVDLLPVPRLQRKTLVRSTTLFYIFHATETAKVQLFVYCCDNFGVMVIVVMLTFRNRQHVYSCIIIPSIDCERIVSLLPFSLVLVSVQQYKHDLLQHSGGTTDFTGQARNLACVLEELSLVARGLCWHLCLQKKELMRTCIACVHICSMYLIIVFACLW